MQSYYSSHNKDDSTLTMSNATSPSAPKKVPRGETPPKPEYTGEVTEQDVFPFLVASQDSVTNGEPPEVDNAKLARQKRKRTRYVPSIYYFRSILEFSLGRPECVRSVYILTCLSAQKTKQHLKRSIRRTQSQTNWHAWPSWSRFLLVRRKFRFVALGSHASTNAVHAPCTCSILQQPS